VNGALRIRFVLLGAVCGLCGLCGCSGGAVDGGSGEGGGGYSFSGIYRDDVRTISVPVFENETFAHGLEIELTDAIIKEIHARTPWRVSASSGAGTRLNGRIISADLRKSTTNSRSGLVQELAVVTAVSFEWRDLRTDEIYVARENFRGVETFVPALGARERLETGQRATIDQLAREIVAQLRSSW